MLCRSETGILLLWACQHTVKYRIYHVGTTAEKYLAATRAGVLPYKVTLVYAILIKSKCYGLGSSNGESASVQWFVRRLKQ